MEMFSFPHSRRAQTLQMPDSKEKFTRCLNFSFRINPALKLAAPPFNFGFFLLQAMKITPGLVIAVLVCKVQKS